MFYVFRPKNCFLCKIMSGVPKLSPWRTKHFPWIPLRFHGFHGFRVADSTFPGRATFYFVNDCRSCAMSFFFSLPPALLFSCHGASPVGDTRGAWRCAPGPARDLASLRSTIPNRAAQAPLAGHFVMSRSAFLGHRTLWSTPSCFTAYIGERQGGECSGAGRA